MLTRAPDLRQARHTSIIENIFVWKDQGDAEPSQDLHGLLAQLGLKGSTIGVEYDTQGLTGKSARAIDAELIDFADLKDSSAIIPTLAFQSSLRQNLNTSELQVS